MKKATILFCTLFITYSYSQNNKSSLHFNSGEVKQGYVNFVSDSIIEYKNSKKDKYIEYSLKDINYVEVFRKSRTSIYEYIEIDGVNYKKPLELVIKGKVSLYMSELSGTGQIGQEYYKTKSYYLKRNNKPAVFITVLGGITSKNFKKAIAEYFDDCPVLIQTVKEKKLRKRKIKEIVVLYNETCND
ncbi:MAG: hypothetical protein COA67_04385 [Lutibacter sp.]|nr:MAG: hypothetical protein COA67_04385 [Lutibacter sp.]